ncbi:MAG: bifunctional nuclease family protein [Candidatus Aenigmarchaeota archaeon]|nr:bifunctional nuclease family protein [Candidatus Aenigmarchaeota archaeon]
MKGKNNIKGKTVYLVLFISIFVSFLSILVFIRTNALNDAVENFDINTIPDLSTTGYSKVDKIDVFVLQDVGVIRLYSGCYEITAYTEKQQAESIHEAITGKQSFRPNIHDLFADSIRGFGMEVLMVKIVDLKNNTYVGRIIIKNDGKIMSLDCKPSDGTAIALRVGAPIYIKDSLLTSQGKYIC